MEGKLYLLKIAMGRNEQTNFWTSRFSICDVPGQIVECLRIHKSPTFPTCLSLLLYGTAHAACYSK